MSDDRTALIKALRSLRGKSCERSLATNSLKLRFDGDPGEKGRAYIWIDPPWRLSLAGRFITGSADWPVWDGVEEPEVNRPLWDEWCALFDPLNNTAGLCPFVFKSAHGFHLPNSFAQQQVEAN